MCIRDRGKTQSEYTWDHLIPYSLNGGKDVDLPDLQESRSDFYESLDNAGMFWEIPTIQAFHSVVPGSIMEFYDSIGVPRDVGSRATVDHYAIRGLSLIHIYSLLGLLCPLERLSAILLLQRSI